MTGAITLESACFYAQVSNEYAKFERYLISSLAGRGLKTEQGDLLLARNGLSQSCSIVTEVVCGRDVRKLWSNFLGLAVGRSRPPRVLLWPKQNSHRQWQSHATGS